MADSKGLKQRPETMAYMDKEKTNSRSVDQGEEGIVQHFGYEIRDGLDRRFFNKVKVGQVDEDEDQDGHPGVGHGLGADGAAAGAGFYFVFAASGLAVFKEEDNAGEDVKNKDGKEAKFKNWYKYA